MIDLIALLALQASLYFTEPGSTKQENTATTQQVSETAPSSSTSVIGWDDKD